MAAASPPEHRPTPVQAGCDRGGCRAIDPGGRGACGVHLELIRASDASAGTIYHHFANKNDIVAAVAQAAVVDPFRADAVAKKATGASPGQLLR